MLNISACEQANIRIHSVLSWLIVHPALQASHFATPSTRQPAPVCGIPFLHVHALPTNESIRRTLGFGCVCDPSTRTSAVSPGMIHRPPGLARLAACDATSGATRAGLRHAMVARAGVHCKATKSNNRENITMQAHSLLA